jgi:hypothetical protein
MKLKKLVSKKRRTELKVGFNDWRRLLNLEKLCKVIYSSFNLQALNSSDFFHEIQHTAFKSLRLYYKSRREMKMKFCIIKDLREVK